MAQKFVVVGNKAYRDAMDAVQDPAFVAGGPVAVFENARMLNEFYKVSVIAKNAEGELVIGRTSFALDAEEVVNGVTAGEMVNIQKISVFPFKERKAKTAETTAEPAAA